MLLRRWIFGAMAIVSSAQALTTLVSFNGTDGANLSYGSLVQGADGDFYGTTAGGGAQSAGTVFRVTPGGTLTTLYNFTGGIDGGSPMRTQSGVRVTVGP